MPQILKQVTGSPFTLTSAWKKVTTVGQFTGALRLAPIAAASAYDIEWVSYPDGTYATDNLVPDTYGEPILGGEDFAAGLPQGDIYLKSASSQIAIVKQAG